MNRSKQCAVLTDGRRTLGNTAKLGKVNSCCHAKTHFKPVGLSHVHQLLCLSYKTKYIQLQKQQKYVEKNGQTALD